MYDEQYSWSLTSAWLYFSTDSDGTWLHNTGYYVKNVDSKINTWAISDDWTTTTGLLFLFGSIEENLSMIVFEMETKDDLLNY